jgi:hypothetical protein
MNDHVVMDNVSLIDFLSENSTLARSATIIVICTSHVKFILMRVLGRNLMDVVIQEDDTKKCRRQTCQGGNIVAIYSNVLYRKVEKATVRVIMIQVALRHSIKTVLSH